jgi:hypothetical protein
LEGTNSFPPSCYGDFVAASSVERGGSRPSTAARLRLRLPEVCAAHQQEDFVSVIELTPATNDVFSKHLGLFANLKAS